MAYRWTVWKALQTSNIWRQVWGDCSINTRIRPVINAQVFSEEWIVLYTNSTRISLLGIFGLRLDSGWLRLLLDLRLTFSMALLVFILFFCH